MIWSYSYRPEIWPAIVTLALMVYLGQYSWRRKYQANYGIRTRLTVSDRVAEDTFEPLAGVHLLRVIQEALSNSRKHGSASEVKVAIGMNESQAHVIITDDGMGFDSSRLGDVDSDRSHFGLAFMRERMHQIGGSMEIDSKPGVGTVLKLDVPTRDRWRKNVESATG